MNHAGGVAQHLLQHRQVDGVTQRDALGGAGHVAQHRDTVLQRLQAAGPLIE